MPSERDVRGVSGPANTRTLIRIALLLHPGVRDVRDGIRRAFVLAALEGRKVGDVIRMEDLREAVRRLTGCALDDADLLDILARLVEKEWVLVDRGNLEFEIVKPVAVPSFEEATEKAWQEFLAFLRRARVDYDPRLDTEDLRGGIEAAVLKLFSRLLTSGLTLGHQIETLPIADVRFVVTGVARDRGLSRKYADAVADYLASYPPAVRALFRDSYHASVLWDILRMEREMVLDEFFTEIRGIVADSNFLIALLDSTDSGHLLARAGLDLCRRKRIPFWYSSETAREIDRLIRAAKRVHNGDVGPDRELTRNPFVLNWRRLNRDGQLSWADYVTRLEEWRAMLAEGWDIRPLPDEPAPNEDARHFARVVLPKLSEARASTRKEEDGDNAGWERPKTPAQVEHDAFLYGLVAELRDRAPKSGGAKNPAGPWLLTFDNLLGLLDKRQSEDADLGLVLQPRALLDYLRAYSKLQFDEKDQDQIVEALLRFAWRKPVKITIEEYTKEIEAKFGGEVEADTIRRILLRSPLREQLEKALASEDVAAPERIVAEILTDRDFVDQVIAERHTREALATALQRLQEKEEKLRIALAQLEAERGRPGPVVAVTADAHAGARSESNATARAEASAVAFAQARAEIDALVQLLEKNGAFRDPHVPQPTPDDLATSEKAKKWLEAVKRAIEVGEKVADVVKSLLPWIGGILARLA